ncbi:MAG: glycosyltransferase family 2 protein [Anaerolineae bacterium]|nr:glycosyltransferase family 2 protein [Anaerolineae bacterium]
MIMIWPKVCISILNWNRYELTIRCLEALATLDYPNYFIVVVDNASTDASIERIRAAFPDVFIIQSETNLGYAGGNELALNYALADAGTDLFWILNNDARPDPQTLTTLVKVYQQVGDAIYGGVALTSDSLPGSWRLNMPLRNISLRLQLRFGRDTHGKPFDAYFPTRQPRIVDYVAGSCFMIPLPVVRKHGFMETSFFLYAEEDDYCARMRREGVPTVLVPEAVVYHIGGASGESQGPLHPIIAYYRARNYIIFSRRHRGWVMTVLTSIRHFISIALMFAQGLVGQNDDAKVAHYRLLGLRDGLLDRMGKTYAPEDFLPKSS